MKRKILPLLLILLCTLLILPACSGIDANASIKSITCPYIAQYECVEARYGDINFLKDYEFIRITLVDAEEMEFSFKPKGGEEKRAIGTYKIDPKTRELEGEIGILGYSYKEKVIVKKGQFSISKILGDKELFMKFETK